MPFEAIFGANLLTKSGEAPTSSVLDGKVVAIYFSAHWCPPCRQFTPLLKTAYETYKSAGKNFEIVFVSSDRSAEQFDEYYGEMPWTALPFSEREAKNKLSKKFKVSGIPSLIILDTDGSTITAKGREAVMGDRSGDKFPWRPRPFSEIIGPELVKKDGSKVDFSSLEGKTLGLYFSAHWCPPCRRFTPVLAKWYEDRKAEGRDDFEIVFISSDREKSDFDEYFGTMPWLALPYDQREAKGELSSKYDVQGIPTFLICDPRDGKVVNPSANGAIQKNRTDWPFPPEPTADINLEGPELAGCDINDTPSLVVLMENEDDSDQQDLKEAITAIAKPVMDTAKASESDPELLHFYASTDGPVSSKIRELAGLPTAAKAGADGGPTVLLMDLGDGGAYYVAPSTQEEWTETTLGTFVQQWRDKALEKKQLKS